MADIILYFSIGLAGLISFLSPCVLPLVPPYLCYLGGVTFDELSNSEESISPATHGRIILSALFFVLGFTTIFVALGAGASAFGQLLHGHKILLTQIAGGIIILFGLHFLGILRIGMLYNDTRYQSNATSVSVIGAYVMGLAFAFGWTPCIGPILSPVMSVAADSGQIGRGVSMLLAYSLGLGVPFILAAIAIRPFLRFLKKFQRHLGKIEKFMGVMLVLVGLLFINSTIEWTGNLSDLNKYTLNGFATWLLENFESLQSIEGLFVSDELPGQILKQ